MASNNQFERSQASGNVVSLALEPARGVAFVERWRESVIYINQLRLRTPRRPTSSLGTTYAQSTIPRCWVSAAGRLSLVGPAFLDALSQRSLYGDHRLRFDLAGNLNCQPMGGRCEGWLRPLRRTPHISVDLWSSRGRCGCIKMACLLISQALRATELGRCVPDQALREIGPS